MNLNSPVIFSCEFHPVDGVKRCKKCFFGSYEVKVGKRGKFFGCHLWSSTGCLGTEDIPEDTDLKPLPKKTISSRAPKESSNLGQETKIEPLSRNGRRWTREEDLLAVELFNSGFDLEEIAENLGRRTTAIRGRFVNWVQLTEPRLDFQIAKRSSDYERHDQQWTDVEREKLLRLWRENCELLEITETLQRPKHQLVLMLFDLNQFKIGTEHLDVINEHYAAEIG